MSPPQFLMSLHCSKLQHKYSYLLWIWSVLHCETHGFIHPEVIIVGKHDLRNTSTFKAASVESKRLCKFTSVTKFTDSQVAFTNGGGSQREQSMTDHL